LEKLQDWSNEKKHHDWLRSWLNSWPHSVGWLQCRLHIMSRIGCKPSFDQLAVVSLHSRLQMWRSLPCPCCIMHVRLRSQPQDALQAQHRPTDICLSV
jgi:hypothetical protein